MWSVPGVFWAFLVFSAFSVHAANYTFSAGNNPPCSGSWSVSGSVYSCSGALSLASGDTIQPASSISINVTAGIALAGNNVLGGSGIDVNLENNYGGINIAGTSVINGYIKNTSGALTITNTTVSGAVTSSNGSISISGGEVQGLVSSACCAVSTTSTKLLGGAASTSNTVTINGGTVAGDFSSGGGSGVVMSGVTMTSGSITTGSVPITISNSTIGSPENLVAISTSNHVYLQNGTVVFGSLTSPAWGQHIEDTSRVYGSCSPSNAKCQALNCSSYKGSFFVNEVNTKENWVELYAKNPSTISGWTLTACSVNNKGDQVCETEAVSYNFADDGFFKVFTFALSFHDKAADYLLKDSSGKLVDYFRVGMELAANPLQLATAQQCNLATACNILAPGNSGQRNFARIPDGGCGWEDSPWSKNTKDSSNDGGVGGLSHIRVFLNNNSTALTCSSRQLDAIACADSGCTTRYGSSVSVTLAPGGGAASIPANGVGTPSVSRTSAGAVSITLASSTPPTAGSPGFRCYSGTVAAPGAELTGACNVNFVDSGFVLSLPDHLSCTSQTLQLAAVRKDDVTQKCVPGFANVSRVVNFSRSYQNPATGSRNPWIGGVEIGAATTPVTLAFDASGVATPSFVYDDAGQLSLTASYSGSGASGNAGLLMTGSDSAIIAPASFALTTSLIAPDAAYIAGKPFELSVMAMNACATPGATPNFGKESAPVIPVLSQTRVEPVAAAAVDGAFAATLGAFEGGIAVANDAKWSEVGKITVSADVSDYLGSVLDITGVSALTGPFRPAYFDTTVTQGCGTAFTYSGQPFVVKVTANRDGGGTTLNYFGAYAKDVTLTETKGVAGTLSNASIAAAQFTAGVAQRDDLNGSTAPTADDAVVFSFATKLTAPALIALRAIDTDGVSSEGHVEGETIMRSGRLRLSNVFGSKQGMLEMPLEAQYWTGSSWLLNSSDSCTSIPDNTPKSVYLFGSSLATTANAAITLVGGKGVVQLTPTGLGSVDVALNLSNCSNAPAVGGTALGMPWLSAGSDGKTCPKAKATFGIYEAEKKKAVHVRELF